MENEVEKYFMNHFRISIISTFLFLIAVFNVPCQSSKLAEAHVEKGLDAISSMDTKDKDWGTAIREFSEAIRIAPNYEDAYAYRSFAYFRTGEFELGNIDLTKAVELNKNNPKNAYGYSERAEWHGREGNYENAIADFTETIRLEAFNEEDEVIDLFYKAMTYVDRAEIYEQIGDTDNAIKDYSTAHNLAPHWHYPLMNRARLYFAAGEDELGVADVERESYNRVPNEEADRSSALGDLYLELKQYDRAITEYTNAINYVLEQNIRLGWNNPLLDASVYVDRAKAYVAKREIKKAIIDYIQARDLAPEWFLPNEELAKFEALGYKVNYTETSNFSFWVWLVIAAGIILIAGGVVALVFAVKRKTVIM